ncbi:MAG: SGNH/GDSL hydrolase family protein [Anaerolineae bacterium]|nr:SGNH/GDSL hydrolase family protein [Anaerolineae bacterium]MCO5196015.1 SGNH/GDSL hydrolase family protein [Anaerolineae bacterium]MCO5207684.1 SGNH/GDSL hydrolase family protein [Anaerolineae bacterium]
MKIAANSKLVMIGDSITDCDRARPIGEGRDDALGTGYVSLVDALLKTACTEPAEVAVPTTNIRIINMGISGNTVRDLQARWQTDVLDLQPDWLSIMIGINDVWRQFDSPLQRERQVSLADYGRMLSKLVATTRPHLQGLVLMTPYFIEPNHNDPMRAMMDSYGQVVQEIAFANDAVFLDTQAAFDRILAHVHPMSLAWDRVHPNLTGHMILARAFLEGVGFTW